MTLRSIDMKLASNRKRIPAVSSPPWLELLIRAGFLFIFFFPSDKNADEGVAVTEGRSGEGKKLLNNIFFFLCF